jgi:hypothetical protein
VSADPGVQQKELADLRWHWDAAYEIDVSGEAWTARFLTGIDVLTAGSADELRLLIRTDYSARKAVAVSECALADDPRCAMGDGERALRQLRDEGVI